MGAGLIFACRSCRDDDSVVRREGKEDGESGLGCLLGWGGEMNDFLFVVPGFWKICDLSVCLRVSKVCMILVAISASSAGRNEWTWYVLYRLNSNRLRTGNCIFLLS